MLGNILIMTLQQGHQIMVSVARRHTSNKSHILWITYDNCCINALFCVCRAGVRIFLYLQPYILRYIWFLSFHRHQSSNGNQTQKWRDFVHDANQTEVVDNRDIEPEQKLNICISLDNYFNMKVLGYNVCFILYVGNTITSISGYLKVEYELQLSR